VRCVFLFVVHKTDTPYQLYARTRLYNPVNKEITERFCSGSIPGSFPPPGQEDISSSLSRLSLPPNKRWELKFNSLLYSEWKLRILKYYFYNSCISLRYGAQTHNSYVQDTSIVLNIDQGGPDLWEVPDIFSR